MQSTAPASLLIWLVFVLFCCPCAAAQEAPERPTSKARDVLIFAFCSPKANNISVGKRWATVTVTDGEGRRHSVDVQAYSTFDAAHLFVTHAKASPQDGLPALGADTVFEVIAAGAIHYIKGAAFQRWILKERQARKGPAGFLFSQRPVLD